MVAAYQPIQYDQVEGGRWTRHQAEIVTEMPVSLSVNGENWLTFLCTPVDLEALAVGFLFNEGVIQSIEQVVSAHVCASGDIVDVWLDHSVEKPERWMRTSGCTGGVTSVEIGATNDGKEEEKTENASLAALQVTGGLNNEEDLLTPEQVGRLSEALLASQDLYRRSGGAHTSALSDGLRIYAVSEDIGRHNTLDKIAGHYLMEKIELQRRILLTTGRVSSEMMQKAIRLGASVVISRTSPSSLSIQMAQSNGITLIGYARGRASGGSKNSGKHGRFRVYTYPERIATYEIQTPGELHAT